MFFSVVIAVLIWFRDRNHHIIVPIIASALMLGIGYFAARLLGNILAGMENTRYLGYLHMELDPEKFVENYRDVPERMKGSDAAITRSYLADGYAAGGDYDKAITLLSADPPAGNLPVEGLYASNLAAYYLGKGDTDQAAAAVQQLDEIINVCRVSKPDLARNLTESLTLHRQHLNCLTGKKVDTDWLDAAFQRAQYNIRRLEIAKVQAMYALREGDSKTAKERLTYLRKNSGKTCFKRWADQQG